MGKMLAERSFPQGSRTARATRSTVGAGLPAMASVASPKSRTLDDQIDYLLDGRDVIPIFLRRLQLELPLDLHDKAGHVVINDVEVMDEIGVLRHFASVDKTDDIHEQLDHFFADVGSGQATFHFSPHRHTYQY